MRQQSGAAIVPNIEPNPITGNRKRGEAMVMVPYVLVPVVVLMAHNNRRSHLGRVLKHRRELDKTIALVALGAQPGLNRTGTVLRPAPPVRP